MNDAVPLMSARSQPTVPELPFSPILPDSSRSEETAASASAVFSSDRTGSDGFFPQHQSNQQQYDQHQQQQEEPIANWPSQQEPWQPVASYDNNNEEGGKDTVDHYSLQQRRPSNDAYGNTYNDGATTTDNTYYGGDGDPNATYSNNSQLQNEQGAVVEQPSTVYYEEPTPVTSSTTNTMGDGADISNAPPTFFNPAQTMGGGVSSAPSFSKFDSLEFNIDCWYSSSAVLFTRFKLNFLEVVLIIIDFISVSLI